MTGPVELGLRANARQFALLVALNALVGGMVGLERSVLPLVGKQDFGLSSISAILAFVVAFGAAKAVTNLAAGGLAERLGRKRLLVIGWLVALPVPLLIGLAPSWPRRPGKPPHSISRSAPRAWRRFASSPSARRMETASEYRRAGRRRRSNT